MKKIGKIATVAAIVAATGFTAYNAQNKEVQMSPLEIENVEAIARGESYMSGGTCYGAGAGFTNVHCPGGYSICCWAHTNVYGEN